MVLLLCAQGSERDSVLTMVGTASYWQGFKILAAEKWQVKWLVIRKQQHIGVVHISNNSNFCMAVIAKDDQKKRGLWE